MTLLLVSPQAHAEASGGTRKVTSVYTVPPEIQALMTRPADSAAFTFTDPVDALLRLLLLSPMGADARNLAFFPEPGDLSDYCNGARMQRVHDSLPRGAAALTCAIFFDEINRDQKGFNTGDGAIVVGGFFRAQIRESTDAKVSFGTFPKVHFPPENRKLDKVKLFMKKMRHHHLKAIYNCFTRFNKRGGAIVHLQVPSHAIPPAQQTRPLIFFAFPLTLQTGPILYFARAVILAIYGDEPAAKKITLTGSGCVQCYVPKDAFNVDNGIAARVPRDRRSMKKRKRALLLMATSGAPQCAANALKKAKSAGVNLEVDNGMWGDDSVDNSSPWGPDPSQDNVYQNMPQVTLHGMDEGLTAKLNLGCVRAAVSEILQLNDAPKPKRGNKKKNGGPRLLFVGV